jgi:hypothetical protein
MRKNDIVAILYQYVVQGQSQESIANHLHLNQREVSNIVREYGFNEQYTGSYQSGKDRGKYKTYKGMHVTEQMLLDYIDSDVQDFESYLERVYRSFARQRNAEEERRKKESEKQRKRLEAEENRRRREAEEMRRRKQAEEAWKRQKEEEERKRQLELLRREEEHRRQVQERIQREEQQRLEQEAKQRQQQQQISKNVHINWLNEAIRFLEEKNYQDALRYADASYDLMPMKGNIYTIADASFHLAHYERAYQMVDNLLRNSNYRVLECRLLRARIYDKSKRGSAHKFLSDVEYASEQGGEVEDLLVLYAKLAQMEGNEKQKEKAIELYQMFISKGLDVLNSYLSLANLYYSKRLWKQVVESNMSARQVCEATNDWDTYNSGYDHWKMGVSYYQLGDITSAYFCFRNGLPMDRRKGSTQWEECLPTEEEARLFFHCLEHSGDMDALKYFQNELVNRKKFLTGKITAKNFYGEKYEGINYRYVYNHVLKSWEQEVVEDESLGTKLLKWIRF